MLAGTETLPHFHDTTWENLNHRVWNFKVETQQESGKGNLVKRNFDKSKNI